MPGKQHHCLIQAPTFLTLLTYNYFLVQLISVAKEALVSSEKSEKLRQTFDRIAGVDGEIDAEELQDMLTISLIKGMLMRTL